MDFIMTATRILPYLLALLPTAALSAEATLYLENDVMHGEDRDYTNGLRYAWISDNFVSSDTGCWEPVCQLTTGSLSAITGFDDPTEVRFSHGISLTQLMYTPDDSKALTQPIGERRYAGWLGLGFSLLAKDEQTLNLVEFIIGTTGPNAFAQETQDLVHQISDNKGYRGWDSQVPNEITADISFIQKRRLMLGGHPNFDGLIEYGARAGTFRTAAHLGGQVRWGFNLAPDFSDVRISETAYSHSSDSPATNWSPYLLLGGALRGVAHDATLDGPVFQSFDTGNRREPLIAEMFIGFGLRYRKAELSYAHTWRSEEYSDQEGGSEVGSLAIRIRF